ncbi:hypothetical protein EV363DRAFT_1469067 [Boletus edulis]|nr:hypothetical protein EV363DRAFT_1469067 [Boletus edulis]
MSVSTTATSPSPSPPALSHDDDAPSPSESESPSPLPSSHDEGTAITAEDDTVIVGDISSQPPHCSTFNLHENSVAAQMDLTAHLLAGLSLPSDMPLRTQELREALKESFTAVQSMINEYVQMAQWHHRHHVTTVPHVNDSDDAAVAPPPSPDEKRNPSANPPRAGTQEASASSSDSLTLFLGCPLSKLGGTAVNWFSEKLGVWPVVHERLMPAVPNPDTDPIEPVLTLCANMRSVDGLSPSVGDPGCHTFKVTGSSMSTSLSPPPAATVLPGPLNTPGSIPSSSFSCASSVEAGKQLSTPVDTGPIYIRHPKVCGGDPETLTMPVAA